MMNLEQSQTIQSQTLQSPAFDVDVDGDVLRVNAKGHWTLQQIGEVYEPFSKAVEGQTFRHVDFDFKDLTGLDTAGAFVLASAIKNPDQANSDWSILSGSKGRETLMQVAADATVGTPPLKHRMWFDAFERLGKSTVRFCTETVDTLAFLGRFTTVLVRQLLNPRQIRWKSIVALIEDVGLNAAPIIMVLSFFIGAVIAFMGSNLLASFGAQIFMVDLVGFSVLREFAVLITAIMLAGRSDSAFTAQIGAMKMRQEVDAMQVIGLDRYETLVVPRAIACLVSAPILTFAAMMSGLAGGMIVAWFGPTDISPILFFARLREAIPITNFWVGMVKAPFFALIIAVVGCRQGLAVTGSVESLGSRTTTSVVQAIFSVIVMDAIFAMLFLEMGI